MKQCVNSWAYIFTLKEGRQKSIVADYKWLADGGGTTSVECICKENGTGSYINGVEEITGKRNFQYM